MKEIWFRGGIDLWRGSIWQVLLYKQNFCRALYNHSVSVAFPGHLLPYLTPRLAYFVSNLYLMFPLEDNQFYRYAFRLALPCWGSDNWMNNKMRNWNTEQTECIAFSSKQHVKKTDNLHIKIISAISSIPLLEEMITLFLIVRSGPCKTFVQALVISRPNCGDSLYMPCATDVW